jgi:hypothetical protein
MLRTIPLPKLLMFVRQHPRWKNLLDGIKNHSGFDSDYLQDRRDNFHADNAGKKSDRASSSIRG